MRKNQIRVGETYLAKVSGRIVPVRILEVATYGGWDALNTVTGRRVHIRSAARLRGPAH